MFAILMRFVIENESMFFFLREVDRCQIFLEDIADLLYDIMHTTSLHISNYNTTLRFRFTLFV